MLIFWILTGLLAAGAAAVIAWRARRRVDVVAADQDASLSVYRRQLAEVQELSDRGLIGPDELTATEAEAGRRLLAAADAPRRTWTTGPPRSRAWVLAGCGLGAALALALYFVVGSPGAPDRPYRQRLAEWRRADPARLAPEQLAAVLTELAKERPGDPAVFEFLGRAQLAAGDAAAAGRSLGRAARLSPGSAPIKAELGEALTLAAGGKVSAEAEAAFRAALAIDPKSQPARYFLGRKRSEAGDPSGALALWRPLLAELPPTDPRRSALQAEMAGLEGRPVEPSTPRLDAQTRQMAQGMVASLAARLERAPDDPTGWARLVRAYGVLGDEPARRKALVRARALFATRPADLAVVEREASRP